MARMDDREVGIIGDHELVLGGEVSVERVAAPETKTEEDAEEFVTPRPR